MRFVKNLIATAAIATVIVALPAGNINPLVPGDPIKSSPLLGETNMPDISTGKESTIVPGVSSTASVPDVSSLRSPVITVESTSSTSHPVTVFEGDDGEISLTGVPSRRGYAGMPIITVTYEPTSVTSEPVSVTKRDGALDERQTLGPKPNDPKVAAEELDEHATYLPKPPVGPGGGRPNEEVKARQMLPITSSVPALISLRQMLPITSSAPAAISLRQMLPPPRPKLGPAEELDAQATYAPKPPVGPGGSRPNEDVEARQMLPITSSAPAVISLRQMLPITSSAPAAISLRQMLPITSSAPAAISLRQMLPITSSAPAAISLRQMLPITSSAPAAISLRHMLPVPSSSSTVGEEPEYTRPGTPFGPHPNPNVEDVRPRPINGPHPDPDIDERQALPTSVTDEGTATGDREGAVTTVTSTSMHTVTPSTSSISGPDTTITIGLTSVPFTVTPEPSTVTETHWFTSTVHMPTFTTTDNCTTLTTLPSSSGTSSSSVSLSLAPFPTINTTTSGVLPTLSIPLNETWTTTTTATVIVTLSPSVWVTGSFISAATALTNATVTTITTDACYHVTCGPTTLTSTLTSSSSSSTTETSTTTTSESSTSTTESESATATAGAVGGSATSIDTCTETSTSTTSSSSSTSSEEVTTQVTVTTHITTTLSGTGVEDQGPPRLTPPPITERDQDPTFSISVPPTNIEDVGPPHLTPPPITRRDDEPPEAGPLDPRPPFTAAQQDEPSTLVTSVVRSAV